MLQRQWQRKMAELRQQPEPVRMRAVVIMTAVSGVALGIVWLTILLPLQLRLNSDSDSRSVAQETATPAAQVGGLQDQRTPRTSPAGFLPAASPSPSLPVSEDSLPVELQP
jgi:hypothetical protein